MAFDYTAHIDTSGNDPAQHGRAAAWPSQAHKGLRRAVLRDFPYSVFHRPTDASIEVIRVLHHSRDIPPLPEDL